MKIIRYRTCDDIDVQFQDEFYYIKEHQTYNNFKNGCIKNPYDRTVFGVGYVGVGEYKTKEKDGRFTIYYQQWKNMLLRCYVKADRHHAYEDAKVCKEWLNFQTFAKWYESHYYYIPNERLHIDKDIKIKGNMVYGKNTCILVPQRVNEIFHRNGKKIADTDLPETIRRRGDKFYVSFRSKGIGTYDTVEECLEKYNMKKLKYLRELVDEYGTLLPNDVREVLLAWTPDNLSLAA